MDWKLSLKDINGKELDFVYFIFQKDGPYFGFGLERNNKKIDYNSIEHDSAIVLFKASKSAHRVELFFKNKLKATAFVKEAARE